MVSRSVNRLAPSESAIQKAYFDWVRIMQLKDARYGLIFAVPNGAATTDNNRKRLTREGLRSGVSDVIGLIPCWIYHGFVAEFKTDCGVVSKAQQMFLKEASLAGYCPFIWRSVDAAIQATELYMSQKIERCSVCGKSGTNPNSERSSSAQSRNLEVGLNGTLEDEDKNSTLPGILQLKEREVLI